MLVPDRRRARELLERHWDDVVGGARTCVEETTVAQITALIRSEIVAFTYSLPTQLLGKLTEHRTSCACSAATAANRSGILGASLAVVVPWVRVNENVLGNSADPYVSNPLRQPRILPNPPNVRSNTLPLWEQLHRLLNEVRNT